MDKSSKIYVFRYKEKGNAFALPFSYYEGEIFL